MLQSIGDDVVLSDDDMESMDQNESSESIAKRNMIALNLQNEAEEEEEVDHFIGIYEFFRSFPLRNFPLLFGILGTPPSVNHNRTDVSASC